MGKNNINQNYIRRGHPHPYEQYIRKSISKHHTPTTDVMIDLKGPVCYASSTAIAKNFQENPTREALLAQTLAERSSGE